MSKRALLISIVLTAILFSYLGVWKWGLVSGSNSLGSSTGSTKGISESEIALNYKADFVHGEDAKCLELTFSTDESTLGCIKLPLTWDVYSSVDTSADDRRVITKSQLEKYGGIPFEGETSVQFVRLVDAPAMWYANMANYYSLASVNDWKENLSKDRYDSFSTEVMFGGTVVIAQSDCPKCGSVDKLYVFKRKLQHSGNNAPTTEVINVTYLLNDSKSQLIDKVAKLLIQAEIANN